MTRQSPPELFAQRPVRSDFGRRRSPSPLTPRRVLIILVLLGAAITGGYVYNGMDATDVPENPEAIPNIQAEMPIKQKPAQPGGVDIPHQDVTVFEQLDQKGAPPASGAVEQLLPAPETPQAPPATQSASDVAPQAPAPVAAPTAPVEKPLEAQVDKLPPAVTEAEAPAVTAAPTPAPAPKAEEPKTIAAPKKEEAAKPATPPKTVAPAKADKPTPKKAEAPVVAARLPSELFTTGEIPAAMAQSQSTGAATTEDSTKTASGKTVQVQLASYPDAASAQSELKRFSSKYAGILGGASLRIVSINLGAKGTYHRIVSSSVPLEKGKAICSEIAKLKGNCILVK